jgi:DNA-binding response OmpR family regulator
MSEIRHSVLASFEPRQTSDAEALWGGCDLSAEPFEVRGKRILLVDDEEPLRAFLRMVLELEGHKVTEARNGAEALSLFTVGEFDLVITDFEMPVMKGNKLASGIKLAAPSLPILMVSASEGVCRGVENPVDALLKKPFMLTDLHCALRRLLSARPDPAQPGTIPSLESPSVSFVPERQMVAPLPA